MRPYAEPWAGHALADLWRGGAVYLSEAMMRTIRSIRFTDASPDLRYAAKTGSWLTRAAGLVVVAVLILLGPGSAWAASILNEDNKAHVIMVTDGRFHNEMHLAPGEAATEVCAKCKFDVKNIGHMDAQDNDLVVITTDGRLEKRS